MSPAERAHALFVQAALAARRCGRRRTLANFILAIVLFTGLILHSGHTVLAPVIGDVVKGSPAEAAGIKAGDRVTAIDGTAITISSSCRKSFRCSGGADPDHRPDPGRPGRSPFMSMPHTMQDARRSGRHGRYQW